MSAESYRAFDDRDRDEEKKLEARREFKIGLDQIDRSEVAPLNMDAIRAKVRARGTIPPTAD